MAGIVIYSRRECHLCEEAKAAIAPIAGKRGIEVDVVDIDTNRELQQAYGLEVPVVFVNGRKAFKYRVDPKRLEELLDR